MIIDRFYSGYLPVSHIYRGTELIWWAAEDHELGRVGQQIHTVINAVMDQAELEALAMECGASVRMSVTMHQGGMMMVAGAGVLLIVDAAVHQSPSAAVAPGANARVEADVTARAGDARAAAGAIPAAAETDATMYALPVCLQRGALKARADADATLRASPSRSQGMDTHVNTTLKSEMRTSPVAPVAGQMDSRTRHDLDMVASQVRRTAAESAALVRCTAAFHNSGIEMITVGDAAMEITTAAELRAAETLAVALQSMAATAIQATLVQSPTVNAASGSRVALESETTVRQGLPRPQTANSGASVAFSATARPAQPRSAAGQMTPMVAAETEMVAAENVDAAARQTATVAMNATMADDTAKAPATGTEALTSTAVTLSTWARPIQRGKNLLIRQANNVRQEGSTLYIK